MARSPIQSKKQDIKNSIGGEGWKQQIEGLDKIKVDRQHRGGGLHNIGGVRNPLPTMTLKELFWKKDVLIVEKNP